MKPIPSETLEEIRHRVPLHTQVEKVVTLLPSNGNRLVGLCPFHEERTPSFTVYLQKEPQDYHCFGCGAHGDVIAFVEKFHGLGFLEAVRRLADRAGIPIPADAERVAPPSLADFAAERGLSVATLQHFDVKPDEHQGRPALRYPTAIGIDRIKFTDGKKPKYTWAKMGGHCFWYGLADAIAMLVFLIELSVERLRLYVVNGEPSDWACYEAGVPAVCLAGGEAARPTPELVAELATRLGSLGHPVRHIRWPLVRRPSRLKIAVSTVQSRPWPLRAARIRGVSSTRLPRRTLRPSWLSPNCPRPLGEEAAQSAEHRRMQR